MNYEERALRVKAARGAMKRRAEEQGITPLGTAGYMADKKAELADELGTVPPPLSVGIARLSLQPGDVCSRIIKTLTELVFEIQILAAWIGEARHPRFDQKAIVGEIEEVAERKIAMANALIAELRAAVVAPTVDEAVMVEVPTATSSPAKWQLKLQPCQRCGEHTYEGKFCCRCFP